MLDSVSEQAGGLGDLRKTRRIKPAALNTDRLPPNAPEAEQGVLGCVLLSPKECLGQCIELFRDGKDVFYDLRHQTIYETLVTMQNDREAIDVITLQQKLKDAGLLDQIGGIPYLNTLQDSVPSAANVTYYAEIVQEKHLLRKLIHACTSVVARVYEYQGDVAALLDEVERDILAIRPNQTTATDMVSLVRQAIDRFEVRFVNSEKLIGLETGLIDLDRKTDGIHGGEMIVVAGFPSTGKTALANGIAVHNALKGIPAAIFTAEMAPVQLVVRALCSESRTNWHHINAAIDGPRLTSAAGRISRIPLHVEPASGLTIGQVAAIARRLKAKHGIKVIVVDYIQLLTGTGDNREQQISSISKGIKSIAMELDCAVLALSQLTDDGKLRESRAIGQDADSVWKLVNEGEWQPQVQPIKLNIEKCRDGETGCINLTFLKTITRFESVARVSDDDVPYTDH